jgi:hypothetical protein
MADDGIVELMAWRRVARARVSVWVSRFLGMGVLYLSVRWRVKMGQLLVVEGGLLMVWGVGGACFLAHGRRWAKWVRG